MGYKASRLKSASYAPNSENFGLAGITYDNNGNIKTLQRYGTGSALVDDLEYTYQGNRLRYVKDKAGTDDHGGDFVPRTNGLYTYQPNGNLLTDNNERITGINYYTFLNQPNQIDVSTLGNIKYKYDGAGTLFKTIYTNASNSVIETWDYLGNLIYKTGNLYQVANPEGRAYYENSKWNYEYFLTDHLGNVRSTFTTDGVGGLTQKSMNDFDPLGVRNNVGLANNTVNRFEYQGKEKETTFGLNTINLSARGYNPTIGRMDKIDPMADHPNQLRFSPYAFSNNDPINMIDPDGKLAISIKPTPREAARMAAHVYGGYSDKTLIGGWAVSNRDFGVVKSNEGSGLKSQIYQRTTGGKTEYAYATAGTENGRDFVADAIQPAGISKQYSQSLENGKSISEQVGKSELTFVGHSLGGGEAALNAMATNRDAVTFNAAGVGILTQFKEGAFKSESKIDAYILRSDPLNHVQNTSPFPHVNGNRNYLLPTSFNSLINGHSIDNMVKELDKRKK